MNREEIQRHMDEGMARWDQFGQQQQTLELFWAESLGIDVEWPEDVSH